MTLLDTRFLRPHPDTVIWWGQRHQCRACTNHTFDGGVKDAERCKLQPNPQGKGGPRGVEYGYCIDARHPAGVCGPHAARYEPRSGT